MIKSIKFLPIFVLIPSLVNAGDFVWQRQWNGCNWVYQKIATQPVVAQSAVNNTTVVNNLIGIPVPVQYTQPIAAQGTTVYGYQDIANYYNQVDMGLLFNQAARLTDQAQQLAGQATTDFQTLVHAEGQYRSQIAQTLAQGQAAKEALLAAKPSDQSTVTQRSFSFRIVQDADGFKVESIKDPNEQPSKSSAKPNFNLINPNIGSSTSAQPVSNDQLMAAVSNLLTNKCVSCHNSEKAAGGLNFYAQITDAQQRSVIDRVLTDDESKLMPRQKDGTPGPRLSSSEISLLSRAMGNNK